MRKFHFYFKNHVFTIFIIFTFHWKKTSQIIEASVFDFFLCNKLQTCMHYYFQRYCWHESFRLEKNVSSLFFTGSVILLDLRIYIKKKEHFVWDRKFSKTNLRINNLKVEVIWLEIKVIAIIIYTDFW